MNPIIIKDKTYKRITNRKCINCGHNKTIFSRDNNFYAYLTCIHCHYTMNF